MKLGIVSPSSSRPCIPPELAVADFANCLSGVCIACFQLVLALSSGLKAFSKAAMRLVMAAVSISASGGMQEGEDTMSPLFRRGLACNRDEGSARATRSIR